MMILYTIFNKFWHVLMQYAWTVMYTVMYTVHVQQSIQRYKYSDDKDACLWWCSPMYRDDSISIHNVCYDVMMHANMMIWGMMKKLTKTSKKFVVYRNGTVKWVCAMTYSGVSIVIWVQWSVKWILVIHMLSYTLYYDNVFDTMMMFWFTMMIPWYNNGLLCLMSTYWWWSLYSLRKVCYSIHSWSLMTWCCWLWRWYVDDDANPMMMF